MGLASLFENLIFKIIQTLILWGLLGDRIVQITREVLGKGKNAKDAIVDTKSKVSGFEDYED